MEGKEETPIHPHPCLLAGRHPSPIKREGETSGKIFI